MKEKKVKKSNREHSSLLGKLFIFLRLSTLMIGKVFLRLEIRGLENVNDLKSEGVLFVANHHSYWDPFLIGSVLPLSYLKKIKRLRFMTAENYTDKKWYGFLIKFVGAYPVYKNGGDYKKSLTYTLGLLKDNQAVLIFPNGKIESEFFPKNAKPGVAYLANSINLQIRPIYITNTYKITLTDFILRKRKVVIKFGKNIDLNTNYNNISTYQRQAVKIAEEIEKLK